MSGRLDFIRLLDEQMLREGGDKSPARLHLLA